MELVQVVTASGAFDVFKGFATGIIPALVVYAVTQRDVRVAKERQSTIREEARQEFSAALGPALAHFKQEFKEELLAGMNAKYLRTSEARIHFENIKETLQRLEKRIN